MADAPIFAHPLIKQGKVGLLLVNLGTPLAPTRAAVRHYLKEFLSDRRVIELPPLLWQIILRGIILNIRPQKTAAAYAKVWRHETDESPLRYYTRRQAEKLQGAMEKDDEDVCITWAMRYGTPSIANALHSLQSAGCTRIAIMALYPQYSATTSASVYDEVFRVLGKMRWQPAIRTAAAWHDDPAYITALANSINNHVATLDWQPDVVLASYHGLPQSYLDKGDPYHCQCAKTTRLLREHLGKSEQELIMGFQSRFGWQPWLTPYTSEEIARLAASGVKKIALVMPCFVADCLETLEEIDIGLRGAFLAAGGTHFTCVPCLNDSPDSIALLRKRAASELAGWLA